MCEGRKLVEEERERGRMSERERENGRVWEENKRRVSTY
jgi:hypothetical protein